MKTLHLIILALYFAVGAAAFAKKPAEEIDYGEPPTHDYKTELMEGTVSGLKDPDSARFRFHEPVKGSMGRGLLKPKVHGWIVKMLVNAKNSYGGYTGEHPHWYLYRGSNIVQSLHDWQVPDFNWGMISEGKVGPILTLQPGKNKPEGIAEPEKQKAPEPKEIAIGMSKEEVRSILGTPDHTWAQLSKSGTVDEWEFKGGSKVKFVDGKVSEASIRK